MTPRPRTARPCQRQSTGTALSGKPLRQAGSGALDVRPVRALQGWAVRIATFEESIVRSEDQGSRRDVGSYLTGGGGPAGPRRRRPACEPVRLLGRWGLDLAPLAALCRPVATSVDVSSALHTLT